MARRGEFGLRSGYKIGGEIPPPQQYSASRHGQRVSTRKPLHEPAYWNHGGVLHRARASQTPRRGAAVRV